MFLHFVTLTFWPNIKWAARTHDGLSLVIVVSAMLVLTCGQTHTDAQTWMNALLPRLSSAWVIGRRSRRNLSLDPSLLLLNTFARAVNLLNLSLYIICFSAAVSLFIVLDFCADWPLQINENVGYYTRPVFCLTIIVAHVCRVMWCCGNQATRLFCLRTLYSRSCVRLACRLEWSTLCHHLVLYLVKSLARHHISLEWTSLEVTSRWNIDCVTSADLTCLHFCLKVS